MPIGVPDWVYPGTVVIRLEDMSEWTIMGLLSQWERGDRFRVSVSLERSIEGRVDRNQVWVDELVATYASRTQDGAVSVPINASDMQEVMVIPVDWSGPAMRCRVVGIVIQDGTRMVLEPIEDEERDVMMTTPLQQFDEDTREPQRNVERPSAYTRLRQS